MTDGRNRCPACARPLPRAAAFCPACGHALHGLGPHARRAAELESSERTSASLALIFGGTLACVLGVPSLLGESLASELATWLALLLVGTLAAALLGPGALRLSLAGRASATGVALGLAGGLLSFAVSWAYVSLMTRALGASPEPTEVLGAALLLREAVLPALVEEWLCRGVLWVAGSPALDRGRLVSLGALLFALLHGLGPGYFLELPHRFAAGLVFGALRLRTGSLLPAMLAHLVHNALALYLA